MTHINKADGIFRDLGLTHSVPYANLLGCKSNALYHQRKYPEALACQQLNYNLQLLYLAPDHPKLAETLTGISACYSALGNYAAAADARSASTSVARRSQTHCSGPRCPRLVREDGAPLDQCAGCLRTYYCGVACQTADWKAGHKKECKALQRKGAGVGRDER